MRAPPEWPQRVEFVSRPPTVIAYVGRANTPTERRALAIQLDEVKAKGWLVLNSGEGITDIQGWPINVRIDSNGFGQVKFQVLGQDSPLTQLLRTSVVLSYEVHGCDVHVQPITRNIGLKK